MSTRNILPGCKRHFLTIFDSGISSTPASEASTTRSSSVCKIARGPEAVAIERGTDLPAIGEGHRSGAVPGFHQCGVVFVERAAVLIHELSRPGFRDHHHHGVGQRIATHDQHFQAIVETGGVGLAVVNERPNLVQVFRPGSARQLPAGARADPVHVAAQKY